MPVTRPDRLQAGPGRADHHQVPVARLRLRTFVAFAAVAALGLGACYAPPPASQKGEMPCPVTGTVRFGDGFGDARSGGRIHQGVDILAPRWRTNVAVAAGTIARTSDPYGGGLGIRLRADDGTVYVYWHLQAYEGPDRRVAPGDVIAYTGDSGNATATHTHFEKRPGGGTAVDPYPALDRACADRA